LNDSNDGNMCLNMKLSCFVSAGLIFSFPFHTCAQQLSDSIMYKESVARIQQVYLTEIGDNAEIYHGKEYIRNGQKANGFPFFESDNFLAGWVSYQGTMYITQNLYYDLVSDEIIVPNYAKNALIALSSDKVDSFSIGTHVFVFVRSSTSNHLISDGYYEPLYSGEPGIYARKEKKLVTGSGSEESKYIQYNNYLIRYKNVFYNVDGKSSLLEVLKDQKDVLKKYIRTNKLDFKKNLESALVLSVIYYSQLKH
jgi:hypothetical protein